MIDDLLVDPCVLCITSRYIAFDRDVKHSKTATVAYQTRVWPEWPMQLGAVYGLPVRVPRNSI